MLNIYSHEILQYLANEEKKGNGKPTVHNFCSNDMKNFEERQKYKLNLEKLDRMGYVNIRKEPYMTGEYWTIKLTPKGYMYLQN